MTSIKLDKIKPSDKKNLKASSKKTGHDDCNLCNETTDSCTRLNGKSRY
jgi:hypothetical protein